MSYYTATFDRIGRNRNVAPLQVEAEGIIELGGKIADYAEPHIRSGYFEVGIDDDLSGGHILAGAVHNAGNFTIDRESRLTRG